MRQDSQHRHDHAISRQGFSTASSAVSALMAAMLLAGTVASAALLPFVARESDFHLTRSVMGADDSSVVANYGYTRNYYLTLHLRLAENYPGAEYIVVSNEDVGRHLLFLPAFGAAGPVCLADQFTRSLASQDHFMTNLARGPAWYVWDGEDSRGGSHRIRASERSDRFVVLVEGRDVDVISVDLLIPSPEQRCADGR